MLSRSTSAAAQDLGLGSMTQSDFDAEQEKLRKKRQQDQMGQRFAGTKPYSAAYMSLTGNQF